MMRGVHALSIHPPSCGPCEDHIPCCLPPDCAHPRQRHFAKAPRMGRLLALQRTVLLMGDPIMAFCNSVGNWPPPRLIRKSYHLDPSCPGHLCIDSATSVAFSSPSQWCQFPPSFGYPFRRVILVSQQSCINPLQR